jgi:hypothetical protein
MHFQSIPQQKDSLGKIGLADVSSLPHPIQKFRFGDNSPGVLNQIKQSIKHLGVQVNYEVPNQYLALQ